MRIILAGDVNLVNVTDPSVPFALVRDELAAADIVFANLECCLYQSPEPHAIGREGFHADPEMGGAALVAGGFAAVGIANNVNYGQTAIAGSIARLDRLEIAHTGAGADRAAARAPAILARGGLRIGFLQRSSVYWPTDHEAGETAPGIAVIRGHTAYQVPAFGSPPPNRPGIPPIVVTWADKTHLAELAADIAALRSRADIVVASFHWGLGREVLQYMSEIAHAAIDAGADFVIGHGPHFSLPIELYNGKPIFYGLGSFSFHTGHGGRRHGDWLGMMADIGWEGGRLERAGFRFVRHDDGNRTLLRRLADEETAFDEIARASAALGANLTVDGDAARIALRA
jgi:poly-gamma-glutamate capsule biosynthesis protein CapA/YwtB (metallophosphatase superfamily)